MSKTGLSNIPEKERKQVEKLILGLCKELQQQREHLGLTQEGLAEKVGVSVNTIKFIEQGRRVPSFPMFIRICKGLKLKLSIS